MRFYIIAPNSILSGDDGNSQSTFYFYLSLSGVCTVFYMMKMPVTTKRQQPEREKEEKNEVNWERNYCQPWASGKRNVDKRKKKIKFTFMTEPVNTSKKIDYNKRTKMAYIGTEWVLKHKKWFTIIGMRWFHKVLVLLDCHARHLSLHNNLHSIRMNQIR